MRRKLGERCFAGIEIAVDALETVERATIARAWVDGPLPLRPGTTDGGAAGC